MSNGLLFVGMDGLASGAVTGLGALAGNCAALHTHKIAFRLQCVQVAADRHRGRPQLGRKLRHRDRSLLLQLFQDLASSDIDLQHGRHSVAPLPYYI